MYWNAIDGYIEKQFLISVNKINIQVILKVKSEILQLKIVNFKLVD